MSYRFADSKSVWHIPLLCVQWKTPDDGQSNCPKHVELYSKNKFEKLVHLVGFIIRIYHEARSSERQRTSKTKYIFLSLHFRLLQNAQWRKVEISVTRNCIMLYASEHYIVSTFIMPNSFRSVPERQVRSLFQSEFSTECDLVLPL